MSEIVIRIVLSAVVVPIITIVVVWWMGRAGTKNNQRNAATTDKYNFVMGIKARYSWLSCGMGIMFLVILGFAYNPDNPTMMIGIVLLASFAAIFIFLAIWMRYQKVVVFMNDITMYRMFRRPKTIDIREIYNIHEQSTEHGSILVFQCKDGKTLFASGAVAPNVNILIERILENGNFEFDEGDEEDEDEDEEVEETEDSD
ncbi:MAG: hypothetical protein FWE38_03780 [Firmicutes bacterium]|nr:hypothetical protein [Bacillota bacterium]